MTLMALMISTIIAGTTPCSSPESSQFDFWVGEWTATYNDTGKAKNIITKKLDGCVIEENFDDPMQTFKGQSWSVYVPATKKWHQTWVDNQGGYIVLTGEFKDNKMMLITDEQKSKEGKVIQKRMTYFNISKNDFDWIWEMTEDGGKTWTTKWKIHYKRNH